MLNVSDVNLENARYQNSRSSHLLLHSVLSSPLCSHPTKFVQGPLGVHLRVVQGHRTHASVD